MRPMPVSGIRERYMRRGGVLFALVAAACGGEAPDTGADSPAAGRSGSATAVRPTGDRPVLLVMGTSLTAGLGVDPSEAYPALLQERIDAAGLPYRVVNAGVSGETSAGALARVDWLLRQQPAVVVLETGANDGLRGLDPDALAANLAEIVDRTRAAVPDARIAIVQMEAPPNYGRSYTSRFREVFTEVADEKEVTLLPFPLAQVAGVDSLNQADGIHPTPSGHRRMADALWPELERLLREALTARRVALR